MDQDSDIPASAQRAEDVTLPADAAERKRVLNILAQRRYRTCSVLCPTSTLLICAGRRRRERQAALENLVSRSVEPTVTSPQPPPLHPQSDGSPSSDSSTSNIASSSDTSIVHNDFPWPSQKDPLWPPDPWNFSHDVSAFLADTSWTTPDEVTQLNEFLQSDDVQNTQFADDFHIAVPELDLLRAAYVNAGRLQSSNLLFAGLTAKSIFQSADCSNWMFTLPENLQPTDTQLAIPHHPVIDVLPWPAVRTKLILMYNLPPELWPRHPSDGAECSLVRMVYDMEDGGVRVTGPDPSKQTSWEVEQRFFETWWWALDQTVINVSNKRRLARGQPLLCSPEAT